MNYLELVNNFLIETDYSDQVINLNNLQDDELRASIWVRDAWTQIQRQEQWSFMAFPATITTVVGQEVYQATDFTYANPAHELGYMSLNLRNNTTERRMAPVSTQSLRWSKTEGDAKQYAISPDRSIKIAGIPTEAQELEMDTWIEPIVLSDVADVPAMAPQFHKAIVWLAMANYAREQGGEWQGLRQAAHVEYNSVYNTMANAYLPLMGCKIGLDNVNTTYRR